MSEEQNLLDEHYMRMALEEAQAAGKNGEVPVGAVLVIGEEIIARCANAPIRLCDPSAHAEVLALRAAALQQGNYRLVGATLYVTVEPCAMCLGAAVHARIERIVFGASEPKAGVLVSNTGLLQDACFNHAFAFDGGVLAEEAAAMMSDFFAERRKLKAALKALSTDPK